jgi:hypothetical protein
MESADTDLPEGPGAGMPDPVTEHMASNLSASGRNTLFCCLSCGMPFSFPDDAYTTADKDVQDIIRFVHRIRKEVRKDDRSRASTMQWQVHHALVCAWHPSSFLLSPTWQNVLRRRPTRATTSTGFYMEI